MLLLLTFVVIRNSWDLVLALSLPPSTTSGLSVHLTTVDPEDPSDDDVNTVVTFLPHEPSYRR